MIFYFFPPLKSRSNNSDSINSCQRLSFRFCGTAEGNWLATICLYFSPFISECEYQSSYWRGINKITLVNVSINIVDSLTECIYYFWYMNENKDRVVLDGHPDIAGAWFPTVAHTNRYLSCFPIPYYIYAPKIISLRSFYDMTKLDIKYLWK